MKILNTYSEKLEQLNLGQKIGIYVCGVTPYDTTHLGHAFTFIVYDSLVRYLRYLGANVTYVQNVTDIDDDILIRAKSTGKSWKNLGSEEIIKHLLNMDKLNALRPDHYTKATEHIGKMREIIQSLQSKKLAYEKNGSVYFDVKKFKKFGKLSKFGYRAMLEIANERGNFPLDSNKKDPLDFVLWQAKKEKEPAWKSPWGKGRPGWHIECSAMSLKYLGPTITIHGGGSDLIFPHHEAEIAQSENFTGQKFVNIWMHAAMVYFENKKMSKSLGNMVFVSDLLKKYNANTVRLLLLSHKWNEPWNYENVDIIKVSKLEKHFRKLKNDNTVEKNKLIPDMTSFFEALNNNFNTPKALDILSQIPLSSKKIKYVKHCLKILGFKY